MTSEYGPADFAAISGRNNEGGFGGDWSSFIVLFLIFAIFGWGRGFGGGFGGGMTGGGGVQDGYVLASDMARISQTITTGLCDGFYNTAQLINGVNMQAANNTAAIQQTLTQGFAGLNTVNVQNAYETRLGIQGIGQQMAQCCCDLRAGQADLKYAIAQGDCQTVQAINMAARDIVDSQNANYRALHDEIVANRIEDKNAQIQAQQQQIFQLQLAASQCAQTSQIIDRLAPKCPEAAYVVQPAQPVTFPTNCCGGVNYAAANGGCGCGAY